MREHPAELIEAKLEVFDWLAEKEDKRIAKSPAGYLVTSIHKDYATPKGFICQCRTRADGGSEAAAGAGSGRGKAAASRKPKPAESTEREAITAYWQGLSPEAQAALQADADATADPEALALEKGPLKRMGQQLRREALHPAALAGAQASWPCPFRRMPVKRPLRSPLRAVLRFGATFCQPRCPIVFLEVCQPAVYGEACACNAMLAWKRKAGNASRPITLAVIAAPGCTAGDS